ncbi:MAG: 16S rRNA (cytosine(1402)-N(4))-methyltransferase RsmH [Bacteroidetes bacterium]|nr:16S rRNA (cytosine(1402)-N(4))-methyltransferase RsmH [Bacteroidota bacterium]MCW5894607.1 16S rRNA (cytosine(1402)-N(4))-methyltransferase RsmH [Bacteroidota bacterium]
MNDAYHTPVLLTEALGFFITGRNGTYVDGTLGGGGHAEEICKMLDDGRLLCFDADEDAIRYASERLKQWSHKITFVHSNFRNLKSELAARGIPCIDGLLLDLGASSFQFDEEEKGFSFRGDERIDMRMDRGQALSGWDVVNTYDERRLADVIWKYGEERNSRRIARHIADTRNIDTTRTLASVIESAVGKKHLIKTLARVFQAIRIEVNDELRSLQQVLEDTVELLLPGGRLVVISYHSLEDRIVKNFFRMQAREKIPSGHKYAPDTVVSPRLRILTKSPQVASDREIARNPRARSAKMRSAEKLAD